MHITSGSRLETGQFNKGVYWQVNLDDVIAVHERPAVVLRLSDRPGLNDSRDLQSLRCRVASFPAYLPGSPCW